MYHSVSNESQNAYDIILKTGHVVIKSQIFFFELKQNVYEMHFVLLMLYVPVHVLLGQLSGLAVLLEISIV